MIQEGETTQPPRRKPKRTRGQPIRERHIQVRTVDPCPKVPEAVLQAMPIAAWMSFCERSFCVVFLESSVCALLASCGQSSSCARSLSCALLASCGQSPYDLWPFCSSRTPPQRTISPIEHEEPNAILSWICSQRSGLRPHCFRRHQLNPTSASRQVNPLHEASSDRKGAEH